LLLEHVYVYVLTLAEYLYSNCELPNTCLKKSFTISERLNT